MACCFEWMLNFVCHTRRRKWAEGIQEQVAEEGVWA